ncbi:hypothetical protein MMC25_004655 [Agyrium rufum]|nr:hypothetical protein [Agyrium rufum]
MANPIRDMITTHVLDSTTGLPATNMTVQLRTTLFKTNEAVSWQARTSSDGRISDWGTTTAETGDEVRVKNVIDLQATDAAAAANNATKEWTLTFHTADYWGEGKSFYPAVEIRFFVKVDSAAAAHFHVPLLLGPWGYTTYRGS